MDQAKYWMWTKRRHGLSSHLQASTKDTYDDSWEEQAFAEDVAGSLGGCVWPPRSYSCSFCGREFTSAQALGGHMNVHRRDRARLKNSPSSQDELLHHDRNHLVDFRFQADELCSFSHNPNPNPKHGTSLPPLSSEIAQDNPTKSPNSSPNPCSNFVEDGYYHFSDLWNEGEKSPGIPESGCSRKADLSVCLNLIVKEELDCKRKRTDDTPILPFFLNPNSTKRHQLQPAVVSDQLSPSSVNDIDLELRLGHRAR
ncbi:hypothetical protein V6N13_005973 [Hibiscus sabdariffa]|uniref:C2H2-type domain-containing protein n=1 Tax=Hibiscus sabdariffa TaxID=183260 RepID=A0ABR2ERN0_9ROSI